MSSDELQTATSQLNQEEIDRIVGDYIDTGTSQVSVYSAIRKLDDIEAGAGEVPDGLSRVCQKCKEEIGDDEKWFTAFGYFYCGESPEPGCLDE